MRRTLLCYGVILSQVGSGSWFVISYSTYFMIVAGLSVDEAFKYTIMNTCVGLVGVNFGIYSMRKLVGRRTILIYGSAIQGLCMLAMAVGTGSANPLGSVAGRNCLVAFLCLYLFSYNAFVGDASYPVSTELVSTRLRSWSVGSAVSLGYFFAWLTGFCSPYFINPENLNWVGQAPAAFSRLALGDETPLLTAGRFSPRAQNTAICGLPRTSAAWPSSSSSCLSSRAGLWRRSTSSSPTVFLLGISSRTGPRSLTRRWQRSSKGQAWMRRRLQSRSGLRTARETAPRYQGLNVLHGCSASP